MDVRHYYYSILNLTEGILCYTFYILVDGTILVLARWQSQSNYLFLSGIISALPILALINMGMQMKNMKISLMSALVVYAIMFSGKYFLSIFA